MLMIGSGYVLDATLITIPSLVIRETKSDFWQPHLVALVYGLIAVALMLAVASRFPRQDFFDGITGRHPTFGRAIVLGYVLFFFAILMRDIRSTVDFVLVALLVTTPIFAVAGTLALCLVAIVRRGRLVVGRMSQVWQPLLLIVIVIIPLGIGLDLNIGHLLPVFQHGPADVLQGSYYLLSYIGEAIGVAMIVTYRSWSFRYGMYSVLLGWAVLTLLSFSVVLALGTEIPARTLYPNYEMVRKVRLTDFLDRFDLPLIGIWLPAMIVKTSFSLFIVSHGVTRLAPKLKFPWVVAFAGVAATVAGMTFIRNTVQLLEFNQFFTVAAIFFQVALPAMLLFLFRKRKKSEAHPQPADGPAAET